MHKPAILRLHAAFKGKHGAFRSHHPYAVRLSRFVRDDDFFLGSSPLNTVMYTLLANDNAVHLVIYSVYRWAVSGSNG